MKIPVELKSVAFDTQPFAGGGSEQRFFHDETRDGVESATKAIEPELVTWLMSTPGVREATLESLTLPASARAYWAVRQPFVQNETRKPGDIDLVACDIARPHETVVVEFKRVKVRVNEGVERVNRLESLGDAEAQVRELHKLGFHRTYLGVLVIVDGRDSLGVNFVSRGLSGRKYREVIEFSCGLSLPTQVGILYIEIVQPKHKTVSEAGVVCWGIVRQALPQLQSGRLTSMVSKYVEVNAEGTS